MFIKMVTLMNIGYGSLSKYYDILYKNKSIKTYDAIISMFAILII